MRNIPSILASATLIIACQAFMATAAEASVLYDFEGETTPGTTLVEDQIGPPFTNFSVNTDRLVAFGGGTGLSFDGSAEQSVNLGRGSNDELLAPLTQGLRVELDFQVTYNEDHAIGEVMLAGHFGGSNSTRAWTVRIWRTTHTNDNLKGAVTFGLNNDPDTAVAYLGTGANSRIDTGVPYRVIAEWDAAAQARTLEVWNLNTMSLFASASGSFTGPLVIPPESVGVTIGSANGGLNNFDGIIDNVSIVAIPETSTYALMLGVIGGLLVFLRRRTLRQA